MSGSPLLTVRGVSKRFGAVQALSDVDLTVNEGEALGLVGSNGAGKSTLVKVIAGVTQPDEGVIEWRGRPVDLRRPQDALKLGIATIHQDLALCDNLDTVENLYLGRELRTLGMLSEIKMEKRARALLDGLSINIESLRVPVASLSGAQRQGVAIARALIGEPQLIILDEPTAALGPTQAARVLELVQRLRDQHLGVLLVSPEMDEVRAVADRMAVLRVGRNTGLFDTKYSTQEQIDAAITGNTAMAVNLQQSLLPHGPPEQNALDVAFRYLPAQAGVGGDWFDVIPLAGARVAVVVGDIVGHGMHAAATMGRLRTAVFNFSMLDLPPDDLLAHLDDLVGRIDKDEAAPGGAGEPGAGAPIAGATCLYAIYDPVTRCCQLARAGHLPPALVAPDGSVELLDVPAGPPLGLGGLPFEAAEHQLAEGSRLVLYTDGLVEDRTRDIDVGLDLLRSALTGPPGRTTEETCDAVIAAMMPAAPKDDIALLVAETRALPDDHIARWDVPTDPAAVGTVRNGANDQLAAWGLDELSFTTELILSELVTNAIRYATGPIDVRLLLDRSLICEVADTSSTSPHLRYAATTDEGGRGLFLVAQLGERWGTRYTKAGKIIWVEQRLPRRGAVPFG
ncbi:SpoIIE family protein phosphatase [Streptomyces bryophytorum]|uniref:Histidine kinase-like ATPase domain-containing protein n=1 Tax=Actinacidiphila bryophytorum TaxID=1436133 RepID=A0A9W4H5M6_9ACTN|nr:SpoIIE family protein phosphatase [Actinacidiphila bryophytorum]MBN6542693.1 SpoIIE family protein phosphatase [Actinacidiphila bryophytorum]CAG7652253.1 Histidine kinase-like ATPase domain-containing protein [Actinacidiphila bryophytorum]